MTAAQSSARKTQNARAPERHGPGPRLPIGVPVSSRGTFTSTKPTVPSAVRTPSARGSGSGKREGRSERAQIRLREAHHGDGQQRRDEQHAENLRRAGQALLASQRAEEAERKPHGDEYPGEEPVYIV